MGGGIAQIPVTMNVVAAPAVLTASPTKLSFTYQKGATSAPAAQTVSITSKPTGAPITASTTTVSGGSWLSAAGSGNTPASVMVSLSQSVLSGLAVGSYTGTVTVSSGGGSVAVPVSLTVIAANAPVIPTGGIVPVYSSTPVIQPGSWVSIYGTNLAPMTTIWNGDFPTSLGGVSVTVNNRPAYLWFVSPGQINFQAPDDTATGTVNVVVTTPTGTVTSTVTLAQQGPSFSLLGDAALHAAGVIITPDNSGAYGGGTYDLVGPTGAFAFATRPVKPGESLVLYGVGFGPTNPPVASGAVFNGAAPLAASANFSLTIGGVPATVQFAGLVGAGLYQVNLTVPNVAAGDQPIRATINGVQTGTGPVVTVGK